VTALAGKVVVVTGAAGGMGATQVAALTEAGARVVALDIAPRPDASVGAMVRDGAAVHYRQLDVTDPVAWTELSRSVSAAYGRVDGLVNNAGITRRARLLEVTRADLDNVWSVNVTGAVLAMQATAPLMTSGASIVNVGSLAALTAHYPVAYTASKWALRGLSRVACLELGPRGIRVNTIHPGFIETAMTASAPDAFRTASIAETPLGRTGTSHEVAQLVVFLLGDGASFITGADIPVDGGASAHGGVKSISDALATGPQPVVTESVVTGPAHP